MKTTRVEPTRVCVSRMIPSHLSCTAVHTSNRCCCTTAAPDRPAVVGKVPYTVLGLFCYSTVGCGGVLCLYPTAARMCYLDRWSARPTGMLYRRAPRRAASVYLFTWTRLQQQLQYLRCGRVVLLLRAVPDERYVREYVTSSWFTQLRLLLVYTAKESGSCNTRWVQRRRCMVDVSRSTQATRKRRRNGG